MKPIRVALIGTGYMGKCHAMAYNNVRTVFPDLPRIELVWLCDREGEQTKATAENFGFAKHTQNWQDAVHDDSIDLVSVTTPNHLHAEISVAAAETGKHVWCEKPMAMALNDAIGMRDAVQKAGVASMVGYNYMHNPAVAQAKKLISDGRLGRVFAFHGHFDEDYLANTNLPYTWRLQSSLTGSGAMGDMMSHLISMATYLVGPVEAAFGEMTTVHKQRDKGDGTKADVLNDDITHGLLRFANGATGNITSSRVNWGWKNRFDWEVSGDKGTLWLNQERLNELHFYEVGDTEAEQGYKRILTGLGHPNYKNFSPAPGHGLGFNEQKMVELKLLLESIVESKPSYPNFDDSLAVEFIMDALTRSAKSGTWHPVGTA